MQWVYSNSRTGSQTDLQPWGGFHARQSCLVPRKELGTASRERDPPLPDGHQGKHNFNPTTANNRILSISWMNLEIDYFLEP